MLALFGLVSLAVDLGRVRMIHAQMQAATDAAAMAAVMQMPTVDFSGIEQTAIDVAAENKADNSSVVVTSADVDFCIYDPSDRSITVLKKGDGSEKDPRHGANAIRVTAHRDSIPLYFAKVVGVGSSAITTVATAYIRGGPTQFGIVGLDGVSSNGNKATIDSYNAANGGYSAGHPDDQATVASNKLIDLGNGDILGDAHQGVGEGVPKPGPNGGATGWTAELQTPLVYPPVTVPAGATQLPSGKTIQGGTLANPTVYKTTNFPLNKSTTITGAVKIYVTGSLTLKGNTIITSNNLPANLQIFVVGTGPVSMNGNTGFYAHLYAPQADIDIHGTPDFYGTMVGKTISFKGTSDIHYDESLGFTGAYRSALVQ